MTPLHLGIPVLKRYDCLRTCLQSAAAGTRVPDHVWIVDNGANLPALRAAILDVPLPSLTLHLPGKNLGLAASWNWIAAAVHGSVRFWWGIPNPADRHLLLCNDDVTFAPTSLERLAAVDPQADFVSPLAGSHAFSCFRLSRDAYENLGPFDEGISPGYAYFEDNDYAFRLAEAGIPITAVDAGVGHAVSQTLAAYTPEEQTAHHAKFEIAKANFVKKWGCLPQDRVVPQVVWEPPSTIGVRVTQPDDTETIDPGQRRDA